MVTITRKMQTKKSNYTRYNTCVYYSSYILVSVDLNPDVTEIAHKSRISLKLGIEILVFGMIICL
jgi:hypothetical protein